MIICIILFSGSASMAISGRSYRGCVMNWKNYDKGPYQECISTDGKEWCMLPGYIDGGNENVNWKYTENPNDEECLTNWTYYDSNGDIIKSNIFKTTSLNKDKQWCALKVFAGGPEGKVWQYCK